MKLIPILEKIEENQALMSNPLCRETLQMTLDFYKRVGFTQPWICYYVEEDGHLVGCAGFKGPPLKGMVEIAYGTFQAFHQQGIGTRICKLLIDLSLQTAPQVKITTRTFEKENFSARVLQKNYFLCLGIVNDPEDGQVWEWIYKPISA
jgi:RimJ/RimL family protein N-acetyltransferase